MVRKKPAKESAVIKQSESEALEYAESILNTLREPLLALDSDLRVIKVNRSFYETFKVTPAETLGQLVYDLGNKQWDIPKLRELLESILPQKSVFNDYEVEHDFATIGSRTMLLNARRVQGLLGKKQVILLAIEDITLRKEIENRLERVHYQELEAVNIAAGEVGIFAESIFNTVREPLLALDPDLRVIKASHSFYETFKVTPAETLGQLVYDLGNKQWDIPKLRDLLESIIPQNSVFNDYEVEHDFATIGSRTMLLNAREIKQELGRPLFILLAIEDITLGKRMEEALLESEEINRRLADYYKRLNDISISFGKADDSTDLFNEIAESFRLLTGANAASFSVYDQQARVLKVMSLSIAPMLKDNVISMFGTDLFKLQVPVSTDDIKQMLTEHIRRPKDLHELSSGQLPRDISASIMDAIDCRQIVALAISYAGEIMGTCIAYLRGDQPVVPDDALKTYIQVSALAVKRKRAEEKWRAALAYNRSLIEASLDPLVTINVEGHITDVNLATEKVTGFLRGEIIGTDFSDYFTEPERARAGYQQVLTAGFVRDYPLDIRHRDGQITPVLYNAAVYRDEQGQVLGIFAAARDVTERKWAEEARRVSDELLQAAINILPVGLWIINAEGKIVTSSAAAQRIWAGVHYVGIDQLGEYKGWRTGNGKLIEAHEWAGARALEKGETTTEEEVEIECFDGTHKIILDSAVPLRKSDGSIVGAITINQDITAFKQTEKELSSYREHLEAMVGERTAELKAVNQELESFSYSVSHDLRAPLHSIDGFSRALLQDYPDKLDEQGKHYLQRLGSNVQKMGELIDDLLILSRITRSDMKLEIVNLSTLAQSIATEVQKTHPERQVEFVITPGLSAKGDEHLLRLLLENLIDNAWKYTGKHQLARIEFGSTQADGKQVFLVRDDGAGFDMTYADKLFAPFQRLHSNSEFPGIGIGLATAQRIINRHGGRIWAEGEIEKGATFYFTLFETKNY